MPFPSQHRVAYAEIRVDKGVQVYRHVIDEAADSGEFPEVEAGVQFHAIRIKHDRNRIESLRIGDVGEVAIPLSCINSAEFDYAPLPGRSEGPVIRTTLETGNCCTQKV